MKHDYGQKRTVLMGYWNESWLRDVDLSGVIEPLAYVINSRKRLTVLVWCVWRKTVPLTHRPRGESRVCACALQSAVRQWVRSSRCCPRSSAHAQSALTAAVPQPPDLTHYHLLYILFIAPLSICKQNKL